MSNFIPHETKRITPLDPPWITKTLKTMLNRKNRLFKNFKRHGYQKPIKYDLTIFARNVKMVLKRRNKPIYQTWAIN